MIGAGSFEYALPRMRARFGRRPSAGTWAAIEQARAITPIIDALKDTTLAPLVRVLPAAPDLHSVDRASRAAWDLVLAEAATWSPPAWAAAIEWCAVLPQLPALALLARGHTPAAWMAGDPDLAKLCITPVQKLAAALAGTTLAPLASGVANSERLHQLWWQHWQRLMPERAGDPGPLATLVQLLAAHFRLFPNALPHQAPQLRRQLETRLVALFRHQPLDPAAAFSWLTLTALDLERGRGELARRLAFPAARIAA